MIEWRCPLPFIKGQSLWISFILPLTIRTSSFALPRKRRCTVTSCTPCRLQRRLQPPAKTGCNSTPPGIAFAPRALFTHDAPSTSGRDGIHLPAYSISTQIRTTALLHIYRQKHGAPRTKRIIPSPRAIFRYHCMCPHPRTYIISPRLRATTPHAHPPHTSPQPCPKAESIVAHRKLRTRQK